MQRYAFSLYLCTTKGEYFMETTGDNLIQVKKERSYISCLVNGWSYGFKHLGMLLRYAWPSLVLTVILPIPFVFLFAAQVDAILRKLTELGYLPNATIKTMRRDIERCANRSAIKVLVYMLWIAVSLISFFLPLFLGLGIWWCLLIFLFCGLLFLPFSVVIMQVSYSDISIKECISSGFKMSYRNYGKLFAFEFLSDILVSIIIIMGGIPLLILQLISFQAYRSIMMGDATDLPLTFFLYALLAAIIYFTVLFVSLFLLSFSRCLMWGSLVNEVPAESDANS